VINASAEFDLTTLQPTYHLTIGLPGRSNALAIAERLGLSDEIVTTARSEISPADLQAEDLLDEIHRQRDLSRQARQAAEDDRQQAETLRSELAARLDQIEDERRDLLAEARSQAEAEVDKIREELRRVRRKLKRHRQPLEVLKPLEEKIEELEEEVEAPIERRPAEIASPLGPIRLGSKVRLRTLGNEGVVTALGEEEAEVQIGVLRVRARLGELAVVGGGDQSDDQPALTPQESRQTLMKRPESPGVELDLRGQRADDALDTLDSYLERAYLAGLPWVRIIHGKGTGKLRQVVREALSQHPHVQSFEPGKRGEGGDGVTVAKLRL
jgi:DNA mismatch repair protein MutS2